MTCKIQEVQNHLNSLINFLKPVHSLANSHLVSTFTNDIWKKEVPENIQEELSEIESVNNFIKLYQKIISNQIPKDFLENHPALISFLNTATKLVVSPVHTYVLPLLDLENLFLKYGCQSNPDFVLKEYMSSKKLHEVKQMSKITASLSQLKQSSHVIDVGGGKGYLSSILALQNSVKVLGLDASQIKTHGTLKMSENVAKLWTEGIFCKKSGTFFDSTKLIRANFVKSHFKLAVTYVTPSTNVKYFLQEAFKEDVNGITLTGLHTCGNLAPTCLKLFLNNDDITSIANIGCCYHLITEVFIKEEKNCSEEECGFPMSNFLRKKNFSLGRNTRMLGSYSTERVLSMLHNDDVPLTSMFYRAILETYLKDLHLGDKEKLIGKIGKKCRNFHEYLTIAIKRLQLNIEITEKESSELYNAYLSKKSIFTALFLLRVSLAPVIESIILLDRFLFLLENGIHNAYLVKAFDLKISPRGFAIVAWKNS